MGHLEGGHQKIGFQCESSYKLVRKATSTHCTLKGSILRCGFLKYRLSG